MKALILDAAQIHLTVEPPGDLELYPGVYGEAIALLLTAYRLAGCLRYNRLQHGRSRFPTRSCTLDGRANVIGEASRDWRTRDASSRAYGRILAGPEYLTVFDGRSGVALKTVDYIAVRAPQWPQ